MAQSEKIVPGVSDGLMVSIRLGFVQGRNPVPPRYLSTAMTCFAGFTYVNASRERLEALLYLSLAIK